MFKLTWGNQEILLAKCVYFERADPQASGAILGSICLGWISQEFANLFTSGKRAQLFLDFSKGNGGLIHPDYIRWPLYSVSYGTSENANHYPIWYEQDAREKSFSGPWPAILEGAHQSSQLDQEMSDRFCQLISELTGDERVLKLIEDDQDHFPRITGEV